MSVCPRIAANINGVAPSLSELLAAVILLAINSFTLRILPKNKKDYENQ